MKNKTDLRYNTPWRKSATAIYKKANDGRVYGTFEVEMDAVLDYIKKKKEEGTRITITQIAMAAIGRAIAIDIPDVNVYISRGKVYARNNVGIFTAVMKADSKEMGGFVLRNIEDKSIFNITKEMDERVSQSKKAEHEEGTVKSKNILASLGWPLRNWVFNFARWWHIILGKELKAMNISHDGFGSAMVTNIGHHDLQYGFPAMLPIANIPIIVAMGKIEERPVVRDGEIVIRKILPAAATLDHRIFDGSQGGVLATSVRRYLLDPECLETPASEILKSMDN
ncbi:MAG: 2-oxo acid dehydrogenase subunit E2 [Candidatus Marinimicrobia bacterium]|nr:2-oxo acid dehydrogenase subunit E2 [Candidatus Neomarinimicrobiota bacterium]